MSSASRCQGQSGINSADAKLNQLSARDSRLTLFALIEIINYYIYILLYSRLGACGGTALLRGSTPFVVTSANHSSV